MATNFPKFISALDSISIGSANEQDYALAQQAIADVTNNPEEWSKLKQELSRSTDAFAADVEKMASPRDLLAFVNARLAAKTNTLTPTQLAIRNAAEQRARDVAGNNPPVAAPTDQRQIPNPAPELLHIGEHMVLKKIAQTADMVCYINYVKGKPTFFYVMSKLNPDTALPAPHGFLENSRGVIITDRDGVLKNSSFLDQPDKQATQEVMIPSALAAAEKAAKANVDIIIATNQAGKNSLEEKLAVNVRVAQQIANAGGHIAACIICPHSGLNNAGPTDVDARKPSPGMPLYAAKLAAEKHAPVLAMIGDQRTDVAAGQGAGLKSFAVTDANGRWQDEMKEFQRKQLAPPKLATETANYQEVSTFAEAVDILIAQLPPQ